MNRDARIEELELERTELVHAAVRRERAHADELEKWTERFRAEVRKVWQAAAFLACAAFLLGLLGGLLLHGR